MVRRGRCRVPDGRHDVPRITHHIADCVCARMCFFSLNCSLHARVLFQVIASSVNAVDKGSPSSLRSGVRGVTSVGHANATAPAQLHQLDGRKLQTGGTTMSVDSNGILNIDGPTKINNGGLNVATGLLDVDASSNVVTLGGLTFGPDFMKAPDTVTVTIQDLVVTSCTGCSSSTPTIDKLLNSDGSITALAIDPTTGAVYIPELVVNSLTVETDPGRRRLQEADDVDKKHEERFLELEEKLRRLSVLFAGKPNKDDDLVVDGKISAKTIEVEEVIFVTSASNGRKLTIQDAAERILVLEAEKEELKERVNALEKVVKEGLPI